MPPSPSRTSPPAYPRHSSNGSRGRSRQKSSADVRLSIIVEDGNPALPPQPQKAHYFHRPFSRYWNAVDDDPPRPSFDNSPPQYSLWDATGPKGDRLWQVRQNHSRRRRGGWKRTVFIAIIVTVVAVTLVIGLVIGLKKNSKSVEPPSPSQSPSNSLPKFPAGSYTFQTHLISVTTNCSSSQSSWTCLPYRIYSESPLDSIASHQWIIASSSPSSPTNLTISSSDNPFNIQFANAALSLLDQGSDLERYTFTANFEKRVPIIGDKSCFYPNASLKGVIYTKRAKSTTTAESSTASSTSLSPTATADIPSDKFAQWRYAVEATVSAFGGSSVPACYHMLGTSKGAQYSEGPSKTAGDICSCEYKNYNL